jgi:hypothetical protein
MITIIYNWAPYFFMRAYFLAALIILALFLATTNAYAVQFSFDPSTGNSPNSVDLGLPAALISAASLIGALLIVNERRKARGIWFSNSERLK